MRVGFDCDATVGVLVKVVDSGDIRELLLSDVSDSGGDGGNGVRASAQQAVAVATTTGCSTLALVRFSVNGVVLRDESNRVMEFALAFPPHSELFPTLTLHSQDVQVLSRFSAADITSLDVEDFDLPPESDISSGSNDIWCLDGLRLETPC